MKVKEFIEFLKTLNQEKEILTFWHSGVCEIRITQHNDIYFVEEGEYQEEED